MFIKATISFTFQPTTDRRAAGHDYELVDSDGFRDSFVDTLDEAQARVREIVEDGLGLSGGVALGAVTITTDAKRFAFDKEVYANAVKTLVEQVQLMAEADADEDAQESGEDYDREAQIVDYAESYIATAVNEVKDKLWEAWPTEKG